MLFSSILFIFDILKAIGKAYHVLSDTQKRKTYDSCPEAFDETSSSSTRRSTSNMRRNNTYYTNNNQYWSDDDFSADEFYFD